MCSTLCSARLPDLAEDSTRTLRAYRPTETGDYFDPLNIAEGAGKPTDKDRSRFHAIARGSAMECGAVLDIMHFASLAEPKALTEAKALLVRLVAMLSKMCR